jgi:hypothetical protein
MTPAPGRTDPRADASFHPFFFYRLFVLTSVRLILASQAYGFSTAEEGESATDDGQG